MSEPLLKFHGTPEPITPEAIYAAYPRKVARKAAMAKVRSAVKEIAADRGISMDDAAAWLMDRVRQYASSPLVARTERQYIPHPATWFNQGRYDDDPDEWGCIDAPPPPPSVKASYRR